MKELPRIAAVGVATALTIGSASGPVNHDVKKATTINGSLEDTWSALIDLFAERDWSIVHLDKGSGLITTDWMNLGSLSETYADCGTRAPLDTANHEAQVWFNVRVKYDDGPIAVTVNASFREARNASDCTSRGAVEAFIQDEVSTRVSTQLSKRVKAKKTKDAEVKSDDVAPSPPSRPPADTEEPPAR